MKSLMFALVATAVIANFTGCCCGGNRSFWQPWGCRANGGGACQSCGGSGACGAGGCNACGGSGVCNVTDPNRYALGGPPTGAPWLSNRGLRHGGVWDTIEGGGCPTCSVLHPRGGCKCGHCASRHGGCGQGGCGQGGDVVAGEGGPPTGQVAYPYYTTRGPRDFLAKNPASIGP